LLKRVARPDGGAWERPNPRRGELPAAGVQEDVERCNRVSGGVATAAVPVDLAATTRGDRPRVIAIVWFTESSAKRIDRGLNRDVGLVQRLWPSGLKDGRRNKAKAEGLLLIPLLLLLLPLGFEHEGKTQCAYRH
jgi:hypothetical protein